MRKVKFKMWIPSEKIMNGSCKNPKLISKEGTGCFQPDYETEGLFHQWGANYEEFENGPGNFTIAIVETSDGIIHDVLPTNLRFVV